MSGLKEIRTRLAEVWPQLLALFVFSVALWAQTAAMVGVFFDDGVYVVLGRALAFGDGYRNIHLPDAPPGVHFPPLYPLVLGALWRVWPAFPANVVLFQLFDAAALGGAAWLVAVHARRWGLPPIAQYLALPLGFIAFPFLTIMGVRFSEPLFLLLWAGAVVVADGDRPTDGSAVLAGALAGLATLARSVGIVILAGIPLAFWARKRRRSAVIAGLVGALIVVPWFGWTLVHAQQIDPRIAANYGTYFQDLSQATVRDFVPEPDFGAFGPVARLLLPALPKGLWYAVGFALVALIIVGGAVVRNRVPALIVSLSAYLVLVSFWPWSPDRFVWILVPWMLLLAVPGAIGVWRRAPAARVVVLVVAALCSFAYLRREGISLARRGFAVPAVKIGAPFTVLAPAIAAETPQDAVIATDREALVELYTGRKSVPSYLFHWRRRAGAPLSNDETLGYFCDMAVTHLALAGAGSAAAALVHQMLARSDSVLIPVFELTDGPALYRFRCPG